MKKGFRLVSLSVFSLILSFWILVACRQVSATQDHILVYNARHEQVAKITDQKTLAILNEKIGESGATTSDIEELPKDAKVSYRYEVIDVRDDGKAHSVTFEVYQNYPYMSMVDVPILSRLTWTLSEEENDLFQHPEDLEHPK